MPRVSLRKGWLVLLPLFLISVMSSVSGVLAAGESANAPSDISVINSQNNLALSDDFQVSGFAASANLLVSITISGSTAAKVNLPTTTGLTLESGYASWTNTSQINFTGTQANINTALDAMTLNSGATNGAATLSIEVSEKVNNTAFYNGHLYEFVPGNISYLNARTAARLRTINGVNGYLVTITSDAEHNFVLSKIQGAYNIWIALSDRAVEDNWVLDPYDGSPEQNTLVWQGLSNGAAQGGNYAKWCGGEPNNSNNEDAAVTKWSGGNCWNDLPDWYSTVGGYVAEYNMPASVVVSDSMVITVESAYFNAVQNLTATVNNDGSVFLDWDAPTPSNTAPYMYNVLFYDLVNGQETSGWGVWTYAANTSYTLSSGMWAGTTGYGPVRFKIQAGTAPCVGEGAGSCLYGPQASVDATVINPTPPTTTVPPTTVPPTTVPPTTVPPTTVPPTTVPPTTVPPATTTVPPTTVPPETTTVPPATTTVPPATTTVPPVTTTVPPTTVYVPPVTTTTEYVVPTTTTTTTVYVPTGTTTTTSTTTTTTVPEEEEPEETTTTTAPETEETTTTTPETTVPENEEESQPEEPETTPTTLPDEPEQSPEEEQQQEETDQEESTQEETESSQDEVVIEKDATTEEILDAIDEASPEELAEIVEQVEPDKLVEVLEELSEEKTTELIESVKSVEGLGNVIEALTKKDDEPIAAAVAVAIILNENFNDVSTEAAQEVFAAIEPELFTEEQKSELSEALTEAPEEIKEAFEEEINIYEEGFDEYVPTGSNIDVGDRRTIIAAATVVSTISTAAATGGASGGPRSPSGGSSGGGGSPGGGQTSGGSGDAARKEEELEEEEEEAGGIEGPEGDEEDIYLTRNSIFDYYTEGGIEMKKMNWFGLGKKVWETTAGLAFTLAGSFVMFVTLSGDTRKMAIIATAVALSVHYIHEVLKNDSE